MAQRPRLLKPFIEKAIVLNKQYRLFKEGDSILLALSGGPDSVFLLHLLTHLAKQFNLALGAVHINHGLRGAAAKADEQFCVELCARLSIPLYVKRVQLLKIAQSNNLSIEEAGRKVRYTFLKWVKQKYRYTAIATAHNLDDNMESVLMAVCSGTGINGLQGIAPKTDGVIRPVLTITKADILAYLQSESLDYCTDESNTDIHFRRNFVRHRITPLILEGLNPNAAEAVMRLSDTVRGMKGFIEEQVQLAVVFSSTGSKERCTVNIEKIQVVNPFIQSEVIKKIVLEYLGTALSSVEIQNILRLCGKQKGRELLLSGNIRAVRESHEIVLARQNDSESDKMNYSDSLNGTKNKTSRLLIERIYKKDVILGSNKVIEYIDADKLAGEPVLRKWQDGDVFFPIGMTGRKKISDFLTDIKMSTVERESTEVVTDGDAIVWVAGQRLDRRYKLTEATKKIYKLIYRADGKNTN
ncbi:MAG: tRNA lysidine(34) synthetase TilS [Ignavibacteriales bacterium]|nr:tRNA lysidine(34) synthetase TilS [Ignavibacteriales bacterium]